MKNPRRKMAEALYVHVPFCDHICSYCDFAHVVYQKETVRKWLKALQEEMEEYPISSVLKTIYIGGGTPSCLSADELDVLLGLFDPYRHDVQEYTIEVNPETADEDKVSCLIRHGINRVSMGLQTSDDALLKRIGRNHTFADVKQAVERLQNHGLHNISLDLMYSLPGQTMDILKQSVHDAIALKPAHLSLYSLTVEANTVFGRTGVSSLDEETEADMYEWICQTLPARGYHQYEISNFALPGYESRHNLTYWHYDDFIGLGCGASGKENHARYDHTRNLKQYFEHPAYRKMIPLTMEDEQFEMVMMNLRLKQGMKLADYQAKFKEDYHVRFGLKTEELKRKGLLEETDGFIRATGRGYEILNSVLVELM
jgi:oxygen-independent coproporphyrinogen-3 oxidase